MLVQKRTHFTNLQIMIQFKKTLPEAVIPRRAGPHEAGFDMTLVRYEKQMAANAYMFDTGIALCPPPGHYAIVVPRSSLVYQGVVLTNSLGVIDPTYTGSIKVVLSFIDAATTLETFLPRLPLKLCQLLFLPMLQHYVEVEVSRLGNEVVSTTEEEMGRTRGSHGFGSTDRHTTLEYKNNQ